ncbi:MAG: hypothetical protein U0792_04545 [Gemmataceae bacterium]
MTADRGSRGIAISGSQSSVRGAEVYTPPCVSRGTDRIAFGIRFTVTMALERVVPAGTVTLARWNGIASGFAGNSNRHFIAGLK